MILRFLSLVLLTVGTIASADARVKWNNQNNASGNGETIINSGSKDVLKSAKALKDQATIDGVTYFRIDNNYAACMADPEKKDALTQVTIQPKVLIGGNSLAVTTIAKEGFANCKKLVHVIIPATIRTVDELAFANNKHLKSVSFLSNNIEFISSDSKWMKNLGPFFNSNKVETVTWATADTPICAFDAFVGNSSPYAKMLERNAAEIAQKAANIDPSAQRAATADRPKFADFAAEKVSDVYNKWVKKKPYESVVQYSDEECEARKRELFDNARNEYINLYTSSEIAGTLAEYDNDYKVFIINTADGNQVFAQVPQSDKTFFEDNFAGVTIRPTYNIVNNELTIVDCKFEIGDKTYVSPEIFDGVADDFSSIDFEARKIDIDDLLAQETAQKQQAQQAKANRSKASANQSLGAVNMAPTTGYNNTGTYALIIGNENYKYNDPVSYAIADATTFARYCRNTLGVPTSNIIAVQDVTKGELRRTIREVQSLFEDEGDSKNLIVYYAGHGIPDKDNIDSYILPVDASANDIESCYSLQEFYNQLGELPAKSVVVYLDACFTGSSRNGSALVASRAGVSFERSQVEPRGNTVVFAATSADETAQPYDEAGHGIFTSYLLDKLRSTKGNITLGDLSQYLITKVKSQSISKGKKRQVPSMLVSSTFAGDWKTLPVNLMK